MSFMPSQLALLTYDLAYASYSIEPTLELEQWGVVGN